MGGTTRPEGYFVSPGTRQLEHAAGQLNEAAREVARAAALSSAVDALTDSLRLRGVPLSRVDDDEGGFSEPAPRPNAMSRQASSTARSVT